MQQLVTVEVKPGTGHTAQRAIVRGASGRKLLREALAGSEEPRVLGILARRALEPERRSWACRDLGCMSLPGTREVRVFLFEPKATS